MAEVVSIHRVGVRDGVAEPLTEATVIAGYGLEGDWRSHRGSTRQITLIDEAALDATGQALGIQVPPGASRRQIVLRGLDLNATVGKVLRVGALHLEITGLCDPCDNMNRKIGPGAREALQNRGGINARAINGGPVHPGDPVVVEA